MKKNLLKLLMLLSVAGCVSMNSDPSTNSGQAGTGSTQAGNKPINNPNSVVLIQEVGNTFGVWFNHFCPVSAANTFNQRCGPRIGYSFTEPQINPNVDYLSGEKFKYFVQWKRVDKTGRFAFAYADRGNSTLELKETSFVINFAPGTVIVRSLYDTGTEAEKAAALQRARAVFRNHYGGVADQMTFKNLQPVAVECLKFAKRFPDGNQCQIKAGEG